MPGRSTYVAAIAALAVLVAGCGSSGNDTSSNGAGKQPTAGAPAGNPGSTQADKGDSKGGSKGDSKLGVDFCSLLTADEVSELVGGKLSEVKPEAAQGSLLGGCTYGVAPEDFSGATVAMAMIHARPAGEYRQTADMYRDEDVSGVGAAAVFGSSVGLLVKLDKAYFLQVSVGDMTMKMDKDKSVTLAKALLEKL